MVPSRVPKLLPAVLAPTRLSPRSCPDETNGSYEGGALRGGLPVGGDRPHRGVQGAKLPHHCATYSPYGPA